MAVHLVHETFPHNTRPALSIQGSRFERPLRRLRSGSCWDPGLAGLVAKGRPCRRRGEAAAALFQALGWDARGEGRRCVLPGAPGLGARERRGFVKHRASPWKPKGTRRRPRGVGGLARRALRSLSDPCPVAGPVGSCSPQAAAARDAEAAGCRLCLPPPNLLERGGGHRGGAVGSVIGRGRLQPPPTSPPPSRGLGTPAPGAPRRRSSEHPQLPRRGEAEGSRTDHRPSRPQHPGRVGDGRGREGRRARSPRAGWDIHLPPCFSEGRTKGRGFGGAQGPRGRARDGKPARGCGRDWGPNRVLFGRPQSAVRRLARGRCLKCAPGNAKPGARRRLGGRGVARSTQKAPTPARRGAVGGCKAAPGLLATGPSCPSP